MHISINSTNNNKVYYEMLFNEINTIDKLINKYTEYVKNNNVILKNFKLEKLYNLTSNDTIYNFMDISIKHYINKMIDIIIKSNSVEEYKDNITNNFKKEVNSSILIIDKQTDDEYQNKCQHMLIDMLLFLTNNILGTLIGGTH
jgi:hypothetical protein